MKTENTSEFVTYTFQIIGSFSEANIPHYGTWYFYADYTIDEFVFLNNIVEITKETFKRTKSLLYKYGNGDDIPNLLYIHTTIKQSSPFCNFRYRICLQFVFDCD